MRSAATLVLALLPALAPAARAAGCSCADPVPEQARGCCCCDAAERSDCGCCGGERSAPAGWDSCGCEQTLPQIHPDPEIEVQAAEPAAPSALLPRQIVTSPALADPLPRENFPPGCLRPLRL